MPGSLRASLVRSGSPSPLQVGVATQKAGKKRKKIPTLLILQH